MFPKVTQPCQSLEALRGFDQCRHLASPALRLRWAPCRSARNYDQKSQNRCSGFHQRPADNWGGVGIVPPCIAWRPPPGAVHSDNGVPYCPGIPQYTSGLWEWTIKFRVGAARCWAVVADGKPIVACGRLAPGVSTGSHAASGAVRLVIVGDGIDRSRCNQQPLAVSTGARYGSSPRRMPAHGRHRTFR